MRHRHAALLGALLVAGLLAGCSRASTEDAAPASESAPAAEVEADPTVRSIAERLRDAAGGVAAALDAPRPTDADWRAGVAAATAEFAAIEAEAAALEDADVPAAAVAEVRRIAAAHAEAARALDRGLETGNLSMVERSAEAFATAAADLIALEVTLP